MSENDKPRSGPSIEKLEESYKRNGGTITEVSREFSLSQDQIYHRLVEAGIHNPKSQLAAKLNRDDVSDPSDLLDLSGGEA